MACRVKPRSLLTRKGGREPFLSNQIALVHGMSAKIREMIGSAKTRHGRLSSPHDHRAYPWDICCAYDLALALEEHLNSLTSSTKPYDHKCNVPEHVARRKA